MSRARCSGVAGGVRVGSENPVMRDPSEGVGERDVSGDGGVRGLIEGTTVNLCLRLGVYEGTRQLAVKPLQPATGEYSDLLHYRLRVWLGDSPTRSAMIDAGLDARALEVRRALRLLEHPELQAHVGRATTKSRRLVVLDAARSGLCLREGFSLSDLELRLLAGLALAATAGTDRRPDENGVRGLRVCRVCRVVFAAPRASVCPPCRKTKGGATERQREIDCRLRDAALVDRAWWTLNEKDPLTEGLLAAVPTSRCAHCGRGFVPGRLDQRYCPGHRIAAWRAKTRAS